MVPADNFLENFASDRSHMLLESAQSDVDVVPPPVLQYFKPMPTWAPIVGSSARSRGESNNLFSRWLDMSDETQALAASFKHNENLYGRVYSLKSFAGKSDWIGPVRASESQRDQAHPSHLAALAEKTYQIPSAPHDSPLLSQPVPLSILASPHESTSEKAAHLAKKAERTVQRALIPVSPEGIGSEGSSGRWPSYLPQKQLVISIFVSLGINFAIPFVNGVMLGGSECSSMLSTMSASDTHLPLCINRLWRDLCARLVRAVGRPDVLVEFALPSCSLNSNTAQDRHPSRAQPESASRAEGRKARSAWSSCCKVHY